MEARALKKYIRSSPRKMRLVVDLIRGKQAHEALSILRFAPKKAARMAEMVLRSAISNLNIKLRDYGSVNDEEIVVKTCFVNEGPTMKRIRPAPMGRAYRVRKRSNHLTIIVATDRYDEDILAGEEVEEVAEIAEAEEITENKKVDNEE